MNLLIKSARVIDANSPFNGKIVDIHIKGDEIIQVKSSINISGAKVFEAQGLHVSPGWFDMQTHFCDPGFEHREDITSGIKAAQQGGFTGVAISSSTHPVVDSKSQVEYILNRASSVKNNLVDVFPVGALSLRQEGKDISEMYDMHLSGAIAFSDDKKPVTDSGLLLRALLYAKNFGGLVMTFCDDKNLSHEGKMNEGVTSTTLGLKGMPAIAEQVMLVRNIQLAEYADAPVHITSVTAAGSVDIIRRAKSRGVKVTASVNAVNLSLEDSLLKDFDTNYKLNPPLRTKTDIEALKKGLVDGTIDVIVSDHRPQDIESKDVEFDQASFGMIGLETAFALVNTHKGKLPLDQIIHALAVRPRQILNIPVPLIAEGRKANITLFNPEQKWTFTEKDIASRSRNTPLIGANLVGKPLAVCNKGQFFTV